MFRCSCNRCTQLQLETNSSHFSWRLKSDDALLGGWYWCTKLYRLRWLLIFRLLLFDRLLTLKCQMNNSKKKKMEKNKRRQKSDVSKLNLWQLYLPTSYMYNTCDIFYPSTARDIVCNISTTASCCRFFSSMLSFELVILLSLAIWVCLSVFFLPRYHCFFFRSCHLEIMINIYLSQHGFQLAMFSYQAHQINPKSVTEIQWKEKKKLQHSLTINIIILFSFPANSMSLIGDQRFIE